MCGRYSLTTAIDQLLPRLKGPLPPGLAQHYTPRQQVRPGEPVLLQRQEHDRLQVEQRAQATPLRVEQIARQQLQMRTASPAITQYVTLSGITPASAPVKGSGQ